MHNADLILVAAGWLKAHTFHCSMRKCHLFFHTGCRRHAQINTFDLISRCARGQHIFLHFSIQLTRIFILHYLSARLDTKKKKMIIALRLPFYKLNLNANAGRTRTRIKWARHRFIVQFSCWRTQLNKAHIRNMSNCRGCVRIGNISRGDIFVCINVTAIVPSANSAIHVSPSLMRFIALIS